MNPKLKSLDIIKGIGIIMIIIVHNRHFLMQDMSGLRLLINFGQMGCQLFFFASGFSLCHSWEHMDSSRPKSLRFILRRYLRLAPGYLIFMTFNLLLNILLMDGFHASPGFIMNREPRAILSNIFFLHGLFPDYINNVFPGGWYIGTAFLLYVSFPPLYAVFQRLRSIHPLCMTAVPPLLLLLNCILLRSMSELPGKELLIGNNTFLYYFFTNQLPCFSLGILLFFQEKKEQCPLAVSVILFAVSTAICTALYLNPPTPFVYTFLPSLAGLSAYWLTTALIRVEKKQLPSSPVSRFLASCGRNSYGMYLTHSLVSWYGMKALTSLLAQNGGTYDDLLLYSLTFLPSVLVIYVMGRYVEHLLSRIDRRLRRT